MSVVQKIYNSTLRPLLPKSRIVSMNGIAVRKATPVDVTDHNPRYKCGTVELAKRAVKAGDMVVEVGAGWGVVTCWAARRAGPSGEVVAFEAGAKRAQQLPETAELNGVADRVRLHHAVVATAGGEVIGDVECADRVDPHNLPSADVMLLDCEGAERSILPSALPVVEPREVVVETHGMYESPTSLVKSILDQHGYRRLDEQDAMPDPDDDVDNRAIHGMITNV